MRRGMRWASWVCAALLAAAAGAAQAAAGQFLFVIGQAQINRAGTLIAAERGTPVEPHDEITVAAQSRAQLRMADGALIALQPSSRLVIDQFSFPAAAAAAEESRASSILRLLKGGLRTITGLISKRPGDQYRLDTPVATIGVRGTDYRLALCENGECGADTPDGLYAGVSNGGIVISNEGGSLAVLNDEYAYVGGPNLAPQRLLTPPRVLETVLEEGTGKGADLEGTEITQPGEDNCHCTPSDSDPGYRDPAVPGKLIVPEGDRLVANGTSSSAAAPFAVGASAASAPPIAVNASGELTSFRALTGSGVQTFSLGGGTIGNSGFDPGSGLRWGRWSGVIQVNGAPVNLGSNDLHWIVSPQTNAVFALPLSGSASYQLVGNTNPTDNQGHVGVLGSASLTANFTQQTLSNSISLSIGNQVWSAAGTASLHAPSPLFGGSYSSVSVSGQSGGASGTFAGFFVPPSGGDTVPAGAGLSYNLTSGPTTVTGAAAFGRRK